MSVNKIVRKAYPEYMIVPALVLFLILIMAPNIASFYYSFTNWNAMSDTIKFIGLGNFKEIFSDTSGMLIVFINSGIFAVSTTVFKIVFGLALALLLNKGIRSTNALRAVFFMPMTLATVLLGIIFTEFYHPDGLINTALNFVGLGFLSQKWLENIHLTIWSCSAIEIWRASGFSMAVFLAGLQMIPKEIYESAEIDGVTGFKELIYITIPYLYQAIVINVILGLISGLKAFDLIYLVTNGGPGRASEVLNISVFNEFSKGIYGYATALGLILFLFITLVYFIVHTILKKYEVDVS